MFNAEEAKKLVAQYFVKGEARSIEWLTQNMEESLSQVHKAAKNGKSQLEYRISFEKENYKLAKKKLLLTELMKLKFKVGVSEEQKREGAFLKTYTVFTISWS